MGKYFIDFLILLFIYLIIYIKYLKLKETWNKLIFLLFYLYISLVLFVTLTPFQIAIPEGNNLFLDTANIIPFNDLIHHHSGALKEIILNILMLTPFGFLLPILKKQDLLKVIFFHLYLVYQLKWYNCYIVGVVFYIAEALMLLI